MVTTMEGVLDLVQIDRFRRTPSATLAVAARQTASQIAPF